MDIGNVILGGAVAGVAGALAGGLVFGGARKIRSAFRKTKQQTREEQEVADYYNQAAYYPNSSRGYYSHSSQAYDPYYYQPSGRHHSGYSYPYRR